MLQIAQMWKQWRARLSARPSRGGLAMDPTKEKLAYYWLQAERARLQAGNHDHLRC